MAKTDLLGARHRVVLMVIVCVALAASVAFVLWLRAGSHNASDHEFFVAASMRIHTDSAIDIGKDADYKSIESNLAASLRSSPAFSQLPAEAQEALLTQALPLAALRFSASYDDYVAFVASHGGQMTQQLTDDQRQWTRNQWKNKGWRRLDLSGVTVRRMGKNKDGVLTLSFPQPKDPSHILYLAESDFSFGVDRNQLGTIAQDGAPVVDVALPVERIYASDGKKHVEQLHFFYVWLRERKVWAPLMGAVVSDASPEFVVM